MSEPIDREEEVFNRALEIPPGLEREAYLDRACGSDAAFREAIVALLEADARPDSLLREPPAAPASGSARGGDGGGAKPVADGPGEAPSGPSSAPAPGRSEAGDQIGRYTLIEKIGEGGMGEVWLARQREPVKREVALKIIKLGMDTKEFVARFEAERQALALMDHPGIARVFDGGALEDGRPFFVMEVVEGVPITAYCDANKLPVKERLKLFKEVCLAVQHAHQKGVIHRDIKPSNVLVGTRDGRPAAKVIDFGIAKSMVQELTDRTLVTGFCMIVGTPAYMSPEQAELGSRDVDTRSDVYALGVLLYELMTGVTPFSERELLDAGYAGLQRVIQEVEPPRPSTRFSTLGEMKRSKVAHHRSSDPVRLGKHLRGEMDWIAMKALEKDRARRYDSARELAHDTERLLMGEPVLAGPPSTWYRFRKFAGKNWFRVGRVLLPILLIQVLLSGFVSSRLTTEALTTKVLDQLAFIASIQQARIEGIINQNLERLSTVAGRSQLAFALGSFLEGNGDEEELRDALAQILRDARSSLESFEMVSVVDMGGMVIASSNPAAIRHDLSRKLYFQLGKVRQRADYFDLDSEGELEVYLSAPIIYEEDTLGVLVIQSSARNVLEVIQSNDGLGETGETLLARRDENGDALFLTPIRFDPKAALSRRVPKENENDPIIRALHKERGLFTELVDYRGAHVLAVVRYLDSSDFGFAVKMDHKEAFASVARMRNANLLITLINFVLMGIAVAMIARSTEPRKGGM